MLERACGFESLRPHSVSRARHHGLVTLLRPIFRVPLGASLLFAGIGHLTFARTDFYAQVPPWLPVNVDFAVIASGVSFGLDSDRDRLVRLLCQPVLVVWALWSTGAWAAGRRSTPVEEDPHVRA